MYGDGGTSKDADALGRRLVESGVRFVQVIAVGWDSHDYIDKAHGSRLRAIDKPVSGLPKDLKQRGVERGVKNGDEVGGMAVEVVHSLRDLHGTMLSYGTCTRGGKSS